MRSAGFCEEAMHTMGTSSCRWDQETTRSLPFTAAAQWQVSLELTIAAVESLLRSVTCKTVRNYDPRLLGRIVALHNKQHKHAHQMVPDAERQLQMLGLIQEHQQARWLRLLHFMLLN